MSGSLESKTSCNTYGEGKPALYVHQYHRLYYKRIVRTVLGGNQVHQREVDLVEADIRVGFRGSRSTSRSRQIHYCWHVSSDRVRVRRESHTYEKDIG